MSSDFGSVQYDNSAPQDDQEKQATNGHAPEEVVIDPNDPALVSEALDMNLDANAYDVPPPAPDGVWRARLKQIDIRDKQGKDVRHLLSAFQNPYRPFYAVNISAFLVDDSGTFDGLEMTDYWVKTSVGKRQKISQLASIGVAIGLKQELARPGMTQGAVLAIVEKGLASEPACAVQTQWQWSCRACDERAKGRGKQAPGVFRREMLSAMQDGKGGRNPQAPCPTCGSQCRAQARVVNYLALAGAKVNRGVGGTR